MGRDPRRARDQHLLLGLLGRTTRAHGGGLQLVEARRVALGRRLCQGPLFLEPDLERREGGGVGAPGSSREQRVITSRSG